MSRFLVLFGLLEAVVIFHVPADPLTKKERKKNAFFFKMKKKKKKGKGGNIVSLVEIKG